MTAHFRQGAGAGIASVLVTADRLPDPATLCVSIAGVEDILNPTDATRPWRKEIYWIVPDAARLEQGALLFDLPPSVTWHLVNNRPYDLTLRDEAGVELADRFVVAAGFRRPSQPPAGYVAPARAVAPPPPVAAEPESEPEHEPAPPVLRVEPDERPLPARPGSRAWIYALAAILVAAAAAVGGYLAFGRQEAQPVVATPAPAPPSLDAARAFLATDPGADAALAKAAEFAQAKSTEGAFLLYRHAATKGSAAAALAVGEMYDPATFSTATSPLPAPNAEQAADWYRRAADTGLPAAQFRLGVLLMSGKLETANGPELGVALLRKAADQGYPPAKDALDKIK